MGAAIVKVDPDVDLYMRWSTVVDNATHVGTRAEMADYLTGELSASNGQAERILTDADQHGSSAYRHRAGHWGDDGFVVHNTPEGWLPRANFAAYAQAILSDDEAAMAALVEPFGGDDDTQ